MQDELTGLANETTTRESYHYGDRSTDAIANIHYGSRSRRKLTSVSVASNEILLLSIGGTSLTAGPRDPLQCTLSEGHLRGADYKQGSNFARGTSLLRPLLEQSSRLGRNRSKTMFEAPSQMRRIRKSA
jgi:hypothetical protein